MALWAPHPGEAVFEQAAIQVPPNLLVDKAAPEPVPALESLFPQPLHLLEQRIEEAVQAMRLRGQDDAPCLS